MKTRKAQHKKQKLELNRISIVNLTSVDMMYVHGGENVVMNPANTGSYTVATTTRTVQSAAPSGPCTSEPVIFITTVRVSGSAIG